MQTFSLTGRIRKETEKAVLFAQGGNHNDLRFVGTAWWPKSVVAILERAMGPLDQILVPEWLLNKKMEEIN